MKLPDVLQGLRAIDPTFDSGTFSNLDALFCFRLFLERLPDEGGWEHWTSGKMTLAEGAYLFRASEECRLRWQAPAKLVQAKPGFALYVDPTDPSVSRAILATSEYEPEVSAAVAQMLRGRAGTFVDVGANIGWYLMLARSVAPAMRLIGFEPNPGNVELCLRSFHHAGIEALVYPFALTDRRAILSLHNVGSNGAVSEPRAGGTVVQAVPGDDLLAPEESVVAIKIDVEGHEPRALRGLERTILRHKPVLVSEFHPVALEGAGESPEQFLRQLQRYGYSLAVIGNSVGKPLSDASPEQVMAAWRDRNLKGGHRGEMHLDLLATPR